MRICGIDPGLRITGYGVIEVDDGGARVRDAGTIRPGESEDLSQRLVQIEVDLRELLEEAQPDLVSVEKLYSHYKHPQTAVVMGHVRGVILASAARHHLPVREYAATQIKRLLTGNGRASKGQVQEAIRMRLGLHSCPEPADVADALAVALCAAAEEQNQLAGDSFGKPSGVRSS